MLFKKETRTISKNGGFIIPVQIRRALGIYSRTQVDIEESKRPRCNDVNQNTTTLHLLW